jgi:hypothetical protein
MATGHTNRPCKFVALAAVLTGALSAQTFADSAMVTNSANGHTYKRFDKLSTWQQAKATCAGQGAYLATVTSQQENDFLAALSTSTAWLGGTDEQVEGTWRWVTGEPWSFTRWNTGEPNNNLGNEDYVEFGGSQYGAFWNDLPSVNRAFICEWGRTYESIANLSDITGDVIPDYATIYRDTGNVYLLTSSGANGAPIKRVVIGSESTVKSASLSTSSGEISVLLSRPTGTAVIQVRDEVTLAVTATINLR